MFSEEQQQMLDLCQRIATEHDREVFLELVKQLNELLNRKDERLQQSSATGTQKTKTP